MQGEAHFFSPEGAALRSIALLLRVGLFKKGAALLLREKNAFLKWPSYGGNCLTEYAFF
jgi:hypothetical protein